MNSITIISNMNLENTRGPTFRLRQMLPFLTKKCKINFILLGEADPESFEIIKSCSHMLHQVDVSFDGRSINNLSLITENIVNSVKNSDTQLVVLGRELFDLMHSLLQPMKELHLPLAVVMHALPFLNAPANPTGDFYYDLSCKIKDEDIVSHTIYTLKNVSKLDSVLQDIHIISINETVSWYFNLYFKGIHMFDAFPGYALSFDDIENAASQKKIYDFSFMAKLEKGKGIFELIDILKIIKKTKKDFKIAIIGSFSNPMEENLFNENVKKHDLGQNITMKGRLNGKKKYEVLKQSKVFLYPSLFSDTFSFCLLEALACDLPSITYNVPFANNTYKIEEVYKIPFLKNNLFAKKALDLINKDYQQDHIDNISLFVDNFRDRKKVADAEYSAYERIIYYFTKQGRQ